MADISWDSAKKLANCLTGNADFTKAPANYQTAQTWVDGLMDPQQNDSLLTSAPCSISSQSDKGTITAALAQIKGTTYTNSSGTTGQDFWALVASTFASGKITELSDEAQSQVRGRDAIIAAVELARRHPEKAPEEIADTTEAVDLMSQHIMAAGY